MLDYPFSTTREEKLDIANHITNRLLTRFKETILAVGIYGSVGRGTEGPFSDIEMHVVKDNDTKLEGYEFIYNKFKIEISSWSKDEIYTDAGKIDDMWPIQAGSFIHILPFMIWEPYETMGKIRNSRLSGNDIIYQPVREI